MSTGDLDAVIAQMWTGFAPLASSRVDVLEEYAVALAAGSEDRDLRTAAAGAAHRLAGALGSYGRAGSDEASRLEVLLHPDAPTPDPAEVRPLVEALRAAVDA